MQTSAVSSSTGAGAATKQPGLLGKDDFLKLLLAQLQNQDPLKPMEDTQFIAQLAQFSTLERMQDMSDRMALLLEVEQLGQANGLLGKTVRAMDDSTGENISGIVDRAKMVDGSAVLEMGARSVKLANVFSVENSTEQQLAAAGSLIGRSVSGTDGATGAAVEGVVDGVRVTDNGVVVMVGSSELRFRDLTSLEEGSATQLGLASGFIGKELEARTGTTRDRVTGIVDAVKLVDGKVVLEVSDRTVKLSEIVSLEKGPDE